MTFVARGSAAAALRGTLEALNASGDRKANLLSIRQPVPLPAAGLSAILRGARDARLFEAHDEDPLRWLIHRETGFDVKPARLDSPASAERVGEAAREALYG